MPLLSDVPHLPLRRERQAVQIRVPTVPLPRLLDGPDGLTVELELLCRRGGDLLLASFPELVSYHVA